MSVGLVALGLSVLIWHEMAHMVAADRYDAFEGIIAFRHKDTLKSLFAWGVAVQVDDEKLTDRQLMYTLLAPLVYVPVGVAAYLGYMATNEPLLLESTIVFGTAGIGVLLSDLPMWKLDLLDESDHKIWVLAQA